MSLHVGEPVNLTLFSFSSKVLMPILKDCEIHYLKADPDRPNRKYDKENPTWEVQLRTRDKVQKAEWKALDLPVKDVIPEDGSPAYTKVSLRKRTIKKDKTEASPVEVVDGKKKPVDPNTVGNGSMANVRIFQYEFPKKGGGTGTASVLMGLQITKHIKYVPKPREDDFDDDEETEVVEPEAASTGDPDEDPSKY